MFPFFTDTQGHDAIPNKNLRHPHDPMFDNHRWNIVNISAHKLIEKCSWHIRGLDGENEYKAVLYRKIFQGTLTIIRKKDKRIVETNSLGKNITREIKVFILNT